ncbi:MULTISPECIES: hypothetical protein [unclassified Streptomyces]|uniref:hypothetical protein n=1 Tax=unclassified Streptomyces TaxID=2593676 RepID=UPI003808C115
MLKRLALATAAAMATVLVPLTTTASADGVDCRPTGGGTIMMATQTASFHLNDPNHRAKCQTDTSWGG